MAVEIDVCAELRQLTLKNRNALKTLVATAVKQQCIELDVLTFSALIKAICKESELSDVVFSEKLETTRETFNRWRNGHAAPPRHSRRILLTKMCELF